MEKQGEWGRAERDVDSLGLADIYFMAGKNATRIRYGGKVPRDRDAVPLLWDVSEYSRETHGGDTGRKSSKLGSGLVIRARKKLSGTEVLIIRIWVVFDTWHPSLPAGRTGARDRCNGRFRRWAEVFPTGAAANENAVVPQVSEMGGAGGWPATTIGCGNRAPRVVNRDTS
jgi:hypothetical protein